jgi:DNA replication licensing factor MCM2
MDQDQRRQVDERLNQRDRIEQTFKSKIPVAILNELEEEEIDERIGKRRYQFLPQNPDDPEDAGLKNVEDILKKEDVKGNLSEWLIQPHVIRFIYSSFSKFVKTYKENDRLVYEDRLIESCSNNRQSLEVNFTHLQKFNEYLAKWILEFPNLILPHMSVQAFNLACEIFKNFSDIHTQMFVRIRDCPIILNIRELRTSSLDSLITIRGVITKRTNVFPFLKKMVFFCTKCGEKKGPIFYNNSEEILNLGSCLICQANGPYKLVQAESSYRNYQKLTIQESPGAVPPGRLPRQKEVILYDDLVDTTRPGDEVEITGIFTSKYEVSANIKHCFPIFSTSIEANYISRLNEIEATELTEDDKIEIRKLSKNTNITNLIFNSIAPSIYGNEFNKKALALAMFGGESKDIQNKHRIRGDINVLLLGDPGMAKSQFLKYVQTAFHRSVYTTGKGASAVGLTAGVHKDPVTKEWTLEGGALVLADRGVCLIDEFDKMNDQDRTSIHEAMEQQSISISKAGIVTTLQARCSVIAAANPISGRYNNQLPFSDNVNLTEPILSRFDILCVVKDEVDANVDNALATFVINSHINSHPNKSHESLKSLIKEEKVQTEMISQEVLRKYITYARKYIHPKNSDLNKSKITKFYSLLRKESERVGGMSIAVRHLESIIRISEAHAKMRLSDTVSRDDTDFAIKMMTESFLMSQKASVGNILKKVFRPYLTFQEDHIGLLINILGKQANREVNYYFYIASLYEVLQTFFAN